MSALREQLAQDPLDVAEGHLIGGRLLTTQMAFQGVVFPHMNLIASAADLGARSSPVALVPPNGLIDTKARGAAARQPESHYVRRL